MPHRFKTYQEEVAEALLPVDLVTKGDYYLGACREVTFQITNACNLRCDYCYECNKSSENMSLETGKKICDLILKEIDKPEGFLGRKTLRGLILEFIGGEPLLCPDLIDGIMSYFLPRLYMIRPELVPFVRISLTTNGQNYFDSKVQKFLKKYESIISLTVSIDGIKELHDAHRVTIDGKGSFDKAIAAFEDAKARGWSYSKMTFVPQSFPYIADSIKFLISESIQDIFCNYAYEPYYNQKDAEEFYYQMKEVSDYLFDNNLKDIYISCLDMLADGKSSMEGNYCGGTGNMLSFDMKGRAFPCLRYHPTCLGEELSSTVQLGDYNGLYQTEAQCKARDCLNCITYKSQSEQKCIDCPVSSNCGWCSANNLQMTGSVNKRVTNICWAHKGRVLAGYYYSAKRYLLWHDFRPMKICLPDEDALQIISQSEWDGLKTLVNEAITVFEKEKDPLLISQEG